MSWQVRFDAGHQQRYLPDRSAAIRYVLAVAPRAASKRFDLFADVGEVTQANGAPGGRKFVLAEVIDLTVPGEIQRLQDELAAQAKPGAQGQQEPAPPGGESQ